MDDYIEELIEAVENCDTEDTEDLEMLLHFLVGEAVRYQYLANETNKKLKEYITAAEYDRWSEEIAKELFRKSVDLSPSEEFRNFCEEYFDEIMED